MSSLEVTSPQAITPTIIPTVSESTGPRKRRKRAPAAGAADDCFTCATQNLQCDRRRPFCSQCLNHGRDCAGYKTQLTWGNGVASRGKLRGLSLPIAGTIKLAPPQSPHRSKRRESNASPTHQRQSSLPHQIRLTSIQPFKSHGLPQCSSPHSLEPVLVSPRHHVPYPSASWSTTVPPETAPTLPQAIKPDPIDLTYSNLTSFPLMSPPEGFALPCGPASSSACNMSDMVSPVPYSTPSEDSLHLGRMMSHGSMGVPTHIASFPLSPPLAPPYETFHPIVFHDSSQAHVQPYQKEATHGLGISYQLGSEQTLVPHSQSLDDIVETLEANEIDDSRVIVEEEFPATLSQLSRTFRPSVSPLAGMGAIGSTHRMQYLINYYTQVISPVIVAFDGPSNPYRTRILHLAARSETLQHAIAALAASNLRQRIESGALSPGRTAPARRSSMAHQTLTTEAWKESGLLSPQEQAREESLHKRFAISSLNKQLSDPLLRMDDSILATLLMLCLFHICDSGVAKFQTQFAGVKKLLSLRKGDPRWDSESTLWITRMFTWFDAMTATVNDREGQLCGPYLDLTTLSQEEWALENLAGCDGQLFQIFSRLGRLNVLSQGNSVMEAPTLVSKPMPQPHPDVKFGLNMEHDYSNFDGNGWVRFVEDEVVFSSKTADDRRHTQFWREWREIRHALQLWELDPRMIDGTSSQSPSLTVEQRYDLANISESFRCSALLYTERLANPTVPSTDPCIHVWVQRCLHYIKAVKSDVYLLWPLFIVGSECVDTEDRRVIRERCLDIQKDSGFMNNQSCLELLEKVWRKFDEEQDRRSHEMDQEHTLESGFRFSRIMKAENNEGEYIVV
ncbi:hypothetical protein B0A52_09551 [Exophiala mesophila]|uniref:Zn(2)-C6 fungal-type domain-containing protein n=1 Tax=Exophiala mesophila TaxID=212818 RepID=A0A438MT50_EXOME|nr:hypothetical protein B0A52_09551 [Exophiala mesophila]